MKLFKCEVYKLLFKRGLLIVFIFCLACEALLTVKSVNNIKLSNHEDQKKYAVYMSDFSGELTREKQKEIEKLIEQNEEAFSLKDALNKQYIDRTISEEEYEKGIKKYNERAIGRNGFNLFVQDYQNTIDSGRYLLDQKPWMVLFGKEGIDFIFVFFIILSVVLLSVYDEESGANSVTYPTKNGRGRKWISQFFILILIAAVSSITISAVKYLLVDIVYGLQNGSFQLNNIEQFFGSSKTITILGGYIEVSLIKAFGAVYTAVFTLFFGTVLRQSLLTVFTSFALVFLPNYILPDREFKYLLPLPSAFLTANGYFFSDNIVDIVYFKALTDIQVALIATFAVLILLMLAVLSYFMASRRKSL